MRLVLALVGLGLVSGVASACSLIGAPQGPGRIWVYDIESGIVLDSADVWQRGLDGDCGLNLAHDLDGQRLAWADEAGDSHGVWIRLLGEDEPPRLVFRHFGRYLDVDLDGDLLSAYFEVYDPATNEDLGHHVVTVNLSTGETREVPVSVDWLGDPFIADGILFWDDVDRDSYDHRLNVYDLRAGTYRYHRVTYESLDLEGRGGLAGGNGEWLLLGDDRGVWAIDWETKRRHLVDLEGFTRLDGDLAYTNGYRYELEFARRELPDGRVEGLSEPPRPIFRESVVDDGRIVLGVYSGYKDADAPGRPLWLTNPAITADFPIPLEAEEPVGDGILGDLPADALAVALAAMVVVAALVRRRT